MNRLPPLSQLRAFEAAARHLSFKAAANELGITPSAISHQIRLLEQYCGESLFRRRPRPLALTWSGEQLFPIVRDGFENIDEALSTLRKGSAGSVLRVTATNAFAARWLVPRLELWRHSFPQLHLDIIGTDTVLNLIAGEADIAVRYMRTPPTGLVSMELIRDRFFVVASPSLVGSGTDSMSPDDLAQFPLIDFGWPATDLGAPTWDRWVQLARSKHRSVPPLSSMISLSFREELHAMEAVIAGQGVAICSDCLVGRELVDGALLRLSDISLPGYGLYVVHRADHPKKAMIDAFTSWARASI